MKKTLFSAVLLLLAVVGYAQLNNSWIDYSKTYYKFRLANDTLCRINQSALPAAIAGTPAQNFQLWRNGQEVRLYTSVATGPLAASDYIEFWGLMNDGKPDKGLYRNADYQLSEKYSLETDTATYYLTVNPVGSNLRYVQSPNNIAGNVLPAETYFMRRVEANYKSQINKGYAAVIGEYVYSSSYDIGEGWASNDVFPCCALSKVFSNLNVYTAGPPNSVMFTIGAVGDALYSRELVAKFYNNVVYQIPMPFFNYRKDTVRNLPLSLLASPTDLPVSVNGNSSDANDRIVVSCISVTYPATFNFNNEKNFYFELKANPAGNYLVINNFNSNGIAPVLYDYNNAKRYLGDIAIPGQVRFVLPASTDSLRKFNLMSQDASNISIVNNLTTKTFTNYSIAANQGNYLIISNPVLYNDGSGVNNVDLYRQYRSSVTGGGFNAKIYDINELTEQFGFGIKRHPSGIRDFIRYAYNSFAITPKYAFIIGRAVSYEDYTILQSNPVAEQIGKRVAELIEDGATLQLGIGTIPDLVLKNLTGHKNLGIHSEMFSDGVIPLVESGVINNSMKKLHHGKLITGFLVGTRKLYDFVNDNPMVNALDISYVNDVSIIRQNPKATSINSAIEIDLTGQVCADSIGTYQYSGIGGQMDFIRGAALSERGKPIIALPSSTKNGEPRIVANLKPGAGVVTTRGHIHWVVTEYGAVNLFGRNIEQRAFELIKLAHPDHREELEKAYHQRFKR